MVINDNMYDSIKDFLRNGGNTIETMKELETILNTAVEDIQKEEAEKKAKEAKAELTISKARDMDAILTSIRNYIDLYYDLDENLMKMLTEHIKVNDMIQFVDLVIPLLEAANKADFKELLNATNTLEDFLAGDKKYSVPKKNTDALDNFIATLNSTNFSKFSF